MYFDSIKNIRIQNILTEFILNYKLNARFYGYFCQYINFRENTHTKTYHPYVDKHGMVVSYNSEFIDSLSEEELRYLICFVCFQFISNHSLVEVTNEATFIDFLSSTIVLTNILSMASDQTNFKRFGFLPPFPNKELDDYTVFYKNTKHLTEINEGVKDYINTNYKGRMDYSDLTDKLIELRNIDPTLIQKLMEATKDMTEENKNDYSDILEEHTEAIQAISDTKDTIEEIITSIKEFFDWVDTDKFFNNSDDIKKYNESNKEVEEFKPVSENNKSNKSSEYTSLLRVLAKKELNFESIGSGCSGNNCENRGSIENALSSARNRGSGAGALDRHLDSLTESRVDYMKLIKSKTNSLMSNYTNRKYTKPNRKGLKGIKGKHKTGNAITCILDTSGSMWGSLEVVLSTIFKHGLHVNLIQIDTNVKDPIILKSKADFSKIDLLGGGGTELQPAIDYVVENDKYNKHNVVILTDGYTDTLDTSNLKQVLILSVGVECDLITYNNVTQIILNPEEL